MNVKNLASSTKSFVTTHKTKLLVGATALGGIVLNMHTVHGYNKYLEEKGLLDDFLNQSTNV